MNQELLASLVWSHLGQEFSGLQQNSLEAKNFNKFFDYARKTIILKVAPHSFVLPFIPTKLSEASFSENEQRVFSQKGHTPFAYPQELLQLYGDKDLGRYPRWNEYLDYGNDIMQVSYSPKRRQKYLLYKGGKSNPARLGIFDVPIELWNGQIVETLSLYMAWLISPAVKVDPRDRNRLKAEFEQSKMETISIDNFEGDKEPFVQRSSISDVIDFNLGYASHFYRDLV